MGLKSYLQRQIIQKENRLNSRQKAMRNLSEMKSALIVCSINTIQEYDEWLNYFEDDRKGLEKLDILACSKSKEMNGAIEGAVLNPNIIFEKQTNWLEKPKNLNYIEKFTDYKYDIVIDLNINGFFALDYVFVKSKAALKIGQGLRDDFNTYYDLCIKTNDSKNQPKLFLDQVFYYLQQMNKNGHK